MSQNSVFSNVSRRNIARIAATAGISTGLVCIGRSTATAEENSSGFPADLTYPEKELTGPSLALWGSSTFEGARATEGVPAGFDARIHVLLKQYLGVPVLNFGRGGEYSSNILARRGVAGFTAKLNFPEEKIPASGSVTVSMVENNPTEWNHAVYYPGYIQNIPGVLKAAAQGAYTFTRIGEGNERYAPSATTANRFYSYQEQISRASFHIIQIGRNNIEDTDLIKEHTRLAFEMAPERTAVLGHFPSEGQDENSEQSKATRAYNNWGEKTYGRAFINPQEYLRTTTKEPWLRYGDLAGSGVWNSDSDRRDGEAGRIPGTFYASDGFHLNGWGYMALARQIQAKLTQLGWFS